MIVQISNLRKKYKKEWVLKGINITVEHPQIIALVGPNGAGKTTLLNCMTNLLSFQEGKIEILGKEFTDTTIFHDISYVQDNRILYDNLTGYDHLKFICKVQDIPLKKIYSVSKKVGMTSYIGKKVSDYSLGMKQHLLLTMAIINQPKLLLLDEPLNGLDPTSVINIRQILLDLYHEGTTIIVSSHNLDEIDRLTNTVYFMKDGRLLKESIEDMKVETYDIKVDDMKKARALLSEENLKYSEVGSGLLTVRASDVSLDKLIRLLYEQQIGITDIEKQKLGAEKRYQELFEEELKV